MAAAEENKNFNLMELALSTANKDRCIEWCKRHNLLARSMKCPKQQCDNDLSWTRRSRVPDGYMWRCSKKSCNREVSIRHNSWFCGSHLSISKILALTYAWAHSFTTSQAMHETSSRAKTTSSETVVDWYNYCREVCAEIISRHHTGRIVEIDESKFCRRKYHRGRVVEGQWVFGGICRETKECFVVPVNSRDKATPLPIIQDRILPGTCVMSDLWRAYDCQNDEGFQHLTVNHSLNFVDPDTGAHTQNIEDTWWVARRSLPQTGRSRDMIENYLLEFLWRRHYRTHDSFPIFVFLEHIAEIYSVNIKF